MTKSKKDLREKTEEILDEEEFRKRLKAIMEVPPKGKKTKKTTQQSKKKKK